jgi:glycerophosphoryl diester phosphodiesterase
MFFPSLPKPAIIAHRGASAYAPENTLASFKLALQQSADAIELDAKLSADKHVVVIHDSTVDRTTPLKGRVRDFIMADLHKMDAGSHFDIAFRGEPIPTLEEVFKAVGLLTIINIELTNYATPFDSLPEKVAELVKQYKLTQRVFFSSFNIIALARIRRILPEVPTGLLTAPGWQGALMRSIPDRLIDFQSLHPELNDASPQLIQAAQKRGRKIFVYTVNFAEDLQRLFENGVDGVFTDDPVLAKNVLEKMRRSTH